MAKIGNVKSRVLKTDLWEESGAGTAVLDRRMGVDLYGVDISHQVCQMAVKSSPNVRVIQADIRYLPFKVGAFDVIFDMSTIDHVPPSDVPQVIREYARVIRPKGGVLELIFWKDTRLCRFALRHMREKAYTLGGSQYLLLPKMVRGWLSPNFDIVEEYSVGSPLVPGAIATRYPKVSNVLRKVLPKWLAGLIVTLEYSRLSRYTLKYIAAQQVFICKRR